MIPRDLPDEERVQKRRIAFKGARNTRDLGGYETEDGRSVKWGVLYRSGDLSRLTRRDRNAFKELGLTNLVDFRSDYERGAAPNRIPDSSSIELVNLPIEDANFGAGSELRDLFISGDVSSLDPDELLLSTYRHFVSDHTATYRQFFKELLDAEGQPLLFNCTAGKDRTGFAAALILHILGVPDEIIVEDYLLTKDFAAKERRREIAIIRFTRGKEAAAVMRRLFSVKAEYLGAAFASIEQEYGSFETYVSEGLQLDERAIDRLRETYLEMRGVR